MIINNWNQVELKAENCPLLRQAVQLVNAKYLTREEALINIALWASDFRKEIIEKEIYRLNTSLPSLIIEPLK